MSKPMNDAELASDLAVEAAYTSANLMEAIQEHECFALEYLKAKGAPESSIKEFEADLATLKTIATKLSFG